ncbi:MAG: MBL fold metallo-hydrolase [Burkholderiales bacterium]|jgi:glyoxylase-like metal-dependent hydrolase (beta-lactamase superfamily II)|nr:MBL fold metallo-hydrolase [Burkholderiales bacterium]
MTQTVQLPDTLTFFERGWLSSNTILAKGTDTVLIDSGYHTHAVFMGNLLDTALAGKHLDRLYNTHLHSDHCGGNAYLQQRHASLLTSIPTDGVSEADEWHLQNEVYERVGQSCPAFAVSALHKAGDVVEFGHLQWQVLASPGHDPDSVLFFCEDLKILISADALWENGFGVLFPLLEGKAAFADQDSTLTLIESLGAKLVIPGHGSVFSETNKALDTARKRLEFYAADPQRHITHAIRVLLKFILLERQAVDWATFQLEFMALSAVKKAYTDYFSTQVGEPEFALGVAQALVGAKVAEWSGGLLRNR